MQKNIDSVKTPKTKEAKQKVKDNLIGFLSSNKGNLKIVFDMQNLLTDAKNTIIRKLEKAKGVMEFGVYKCRG